MRRATNMLAATGVAYALAGDREQAFKYLDEAYQTHTDEILMVIRYPALDPLRGDRRYKDLMKMLGLPE